MDVNMFNFRIFVVDDLCEPAYKYEHNAALWHADSKIYIKPQFSES